MTDNTQELDDIHTLIHQPSFAVVYPETERELGYPVARRILDWHNKQVEAKLAHISEYAENVISIDENGEFSMKAIPLSLVAVERNKLTMANSPQLKALEEV